MNKGFTLIELLGVIVILGILTLIVTVSVGDVLNNSKKNLSDVQKKEIEDAAEVYYLKEGINSANFESETEETCVNASYLIDMGYIDGTAILDPKDNERMTGSVRIIYNSNQYIYKYQDIECQDSEL